MALRLLNRDIDLLAALAEHSILTTEQLAHLQGMSGLQVARRRVAQLEKEGLLQSRERQFCRRRGRPEKIISIAPEGVRLLRGRRALPDWVSDEALLNDSEWDEGHQLLLGWFRVHLAHLARETPSLEAAFLSSKSPLAPRALSGRPLLWEEFQSRSDRRRKLRFIPDGVFRITRVADGQSALFFLEVDMDNEPLACRDGKGGDLRTKLLRYQEYFQAQGYTKYCEFWRTTFRGFRLLFVTCTASRREKVCGLARAMPPSGFVWVTDAGRLFRHGLGGPIWHCGGQTDTQPESMFRTTAVSQSPLPLLHK